eukprot:scaffold122455_cov33-Phaeocystis_antarctica.AAC.1
MSQKNATIITCGDAIGVLGRCHWYPEDTGVFIKKNGAFFYCPSTHHSKAVRVRGCSPRKSAKVPPPHPGRLSLSCAARPRAVHTTAASPPRASAPH